MAGTAATRRIMARSNLFTGLMAWGSSSMNGGLPSQGSPVPHNIRDLLTQTIHPLPYLNISKGGLTTHHNRVHAGLDMPRVQFPNARAGSAGKVRVGAVVHDINPHRNFTCHGTINGTKGWLRGEGDYFSWQPDDGRTRVKNGNFISDHRAQALKGSGKGRHYHLLWVGKNNITAGGGSTVITHTDQLVSHLGGPGRSIVMGQWITPIDNANQIAGCNKVAAHQRKKYGAHFLDVQRLLSTKEGLSSPPVEGLKLWSKSAVQADIKKGRTPSAIVGSDRMHLNGWGNAIITWALIEKMKELAWL